jgi:hypothetical protein
MLLWSNLNLIINSTTALNEIGNLPNKSAKLSYAEIAKIQLKNEIKN